MTVRESACVNCLEIAEYDQRLARGDSSREILSAFASRGVNPGTFQNRRTQAKQAHPRTPEVYHDIPPGHPGTLEAYQDVIEEVHHSVPNAPHLGTDEVHPSTPEVHPELSVGDSGTVHLGVPARQAHDISTPPGHPGTPTEEDWELWTTIKARWLEVEKLLANRQALLSTPLGTPGHTQKKTYVFDAQHIALIDRYAQDHRLDLKEVIYTMCQEFFERRGYVSPA